MTQITTTNPATDETLAHYDVMSAENAFKKIEACHAAFTEWKTKSHNERAKKLRDIAARLRDNADKFANLMTMEMGKLLRDGKMEVELCARIFEYTAENGPSELADEERKHTGGKKRGIVTYAPIGVIYSIQPWNFPLYQPVRVLAANLMAGNGVILKHASICTGSGLLLRDVCLAASLPEGLFDVLVIDHDTSDKIIEHKLVRGVTMTGITVGSSGYTAFVDFADVVFNAAVTARCALIYNFSQGNKSIAVLDFGSDKTSANFTITMPANNATAALIRSSN